MKRRLYFLIPDRQHALAVVEDLEQNGIERQNIHAIGDRRTRMDGLPISSDRQRRDSASILEKFLWNTNLACFMLALLALVVMPVYTGLSWWLLLPIGIMAINFLIGLGFSKVPNTHLDEFRDALAHGEILLMVDVPESQVARVEDNIHHHHPEATAGGVGWSTSAFSL